MTQKAQSGKTEVDVTKRTKSELKKTNNMRRENLSLLNSRTATPRSGSFGTIERVFKTPDLGDISGEFNVDFDAYNERQLFGNQVGATAVITFSNVPDTLSLNLKLYMTSAIRTSLTVAGTLIFNAISDPYNLGRIDQNDFLSIELESSTGSTTVNIISVKKNDESEGANVAPNKPGNIYAISNTNSTVDLSWDQPTIGTLPITYNIAWSTSSAGDSTNGPTTPAPDSPITGVTGNLHRVTGLLSATTYYFWVQGVNSVGSGEYAGPQQTNTEGTTNPGNVNFSAIDTDFRTNTIIWSNSGTESLLFTLFRTDGDGSNRVTFQTRSTNTGTWVDTYQLNPSTLYKYTIQVYNEYNTQLGAITADVTTRVIPAPTFDLTVVNGRRLNFEITFPAYTSLVEIDYSLNSLFPVGEFVRRRYARPIGDWTIPSTPTDYQTSDLNRGVTYYARARIIKDGQNGTYSPTENATTLIPPPPMRIATVNGDADAPSGLLRIDVRFGDRNSVNESAVLTFRDSASVKGYYAYPGFVWSRDNPPADDLDPTDEDSIQCVRGGGGYGASGTIIVSGGAVTGVNITNGGNGYTRNEQIRIYDDEASKNGTFRGTASGVNNGRLTSISIQNGGSSWTNGRSVYFVGYANNPKDIPSPGEKENVDVKPWRSGNRVNCRVVVINDVGESPEDTGSNFDIPTD